MNLIIDRKLQKELLIHMAAVYPERTPKDFQGFDTIDRTILAANLLYLEDHELIQSGVATFMEGGYGHTGSKITHKGIDFLTDDGGLSAILGVVTVRFHADTVRALLLDKIDTSDLPVEEKSRLKVHLASLSGEAWKEAGKYLMQQGLHRLPNAIEWLYKTLSHAQ